MIENEYILIWGCLLSGNNIRFVDDMAVIKAFDDDKEATRELVRSKDEILVYHTGNEKIEVEIKDIFGFWGAI